MVGDPLDRLAGESIDARFDALVESYLAALRRGEEPVVSDYTGSHPDLAARINDVFPALRLLERRESSAAGTQPAANPAGLVAGGGVPATRLGDYRILREVGRGGMGIVYEAEQESLGRHVALKILSSHQLLDARRLERFRREARAAAALQHPNIVPVYGVGEAEGLCYYIMQYVPGQGLDVVLSELKRMRESGDFPSPKARTPSSPATAGTSSAMELLGVRPSSSGPVCEAPPGDVPVASLEVAYYSNVARLGAKVARALEYAHEQGILHRDIKPSNLLLSRGDVWVTDFGLAKTEGSDDLTGSGELVGTLRYMAPERFRGESDPRGDVYSLGLTLYELLTLRPAFGDADRDRLMRKVLEEDPERPRRLDPNIPPELEAVTLRAMAKKPERRYPSAAALAEDLERFVDQRPVEARPPSTLERGVDWARRRPAAAGLLGVGSTTVVCLLSLTGYRASVQSEDAALGREATTEAAGHGKASPALPAGQPLAWSDAGGEEIQRRVKLFPVGSPSPFGVAAADMNGDGRPDLVTVNKIGSNNVSVLLNEGSRSFKETGSHPAVGLSPLDLVVADLDGDGHPDVATVNLDSKDVSVLRNLGGSKLAEAVQYSLGFRAYALATGDFDGDQDIDLAVSTSPDSVCILVNQGDGTFPSSSSVVVGAGPGGSLSADLNGDGRADLALVLEKADEVVVLLGGAEESLAPAASYPCGKHPVDIAAGDLDAGGGLDLAVISFESNSLTLFLNQGSGAFRVHATVPVSVQPFSVAVADLNGDRRPDLAVNDEIEGNILVLFNEGKAEFKRGKRFPTDGQPFRLVSADLDGEGGADVAATNGATNAVAVLFGE